MTLRLYNTLTRTIEPLSPLKPGAVSMYVCGPTVYDEPHIGHARSAFVFDVWRRYLESQQFQVTCVRNVTDVDDKIIEKARQGSRLGPPHGLAGPPSFVAEAQGSGTLAERCREVAERYLKSYHEAMAKLGIQPPTIEPKATEHVVPEMTDLIATLLMQGAAYEAGGPAGAEGSGADRDVYFSVRKWERYGALSNRTVDELQTGLPAPRQPSGDEHKKDPLDFALWKAAKPEEPSWDSPWGRGRPGWHIECSAMSLKYLGDAFDIHGGGLDLIFPHHENEIAQAQAAGKPFATYWIHHGLLTVKGEKMSKSLGNFITVDQALQSCGGQADVLKTLFLGTHYRSPVDYAASNLQTAAQRWKNWMRIFDLPATQPAGATLQAFAPLARAFQDAMDDDLNTPRALAALDQIANAAAQEPTRAPAARALLSTLGRLLGLFGKAGEAVVPNDVKVLVEQREHARRAKDFGAADRLRQEVAAKGFVIEDTASGPVVLPKR